MRIACQSAVVAPTFDPKNIDCAMVTIYTVDSQGRSAKPHINNAVAAKMVGKITLMAVQADLSSSWPERRAQRRLPKIRKSLNDWILLRYAG